LPKGPWSASSWGSCSKSCGGGTQSRSVTCSYSGGCTGSKPSSSRSCNTHSCPVQQPRSYSWTHGSASWSACNKSCGGGTQSIWLGCWDNTARKLVSSSNCNAATRPQTVRSCNTQSCGGFNRPVEQPLPGRVDLFDRPELELR
jgi:hypothetical protein